MQQSDDSRQLILQPGLRADCRRARRASSSASSTRNASSRSRTSPGGTGSPPPGSSSGSSCESATPARRRGGPPRHDARHAAPGPRSVVWNRPVPADLSDGTVRSLGPQLGSTQVQGLPPGLGIGTGFGDLEEQFAHRSSMSASLADEPAPETSQTGTSAGAARPGRPVTGSSRSWYRSSHGGGEHPYVGELLFFVPDAVDPRFTDPGVVVHVQRVARRRRHRGDRRPLHVRGREGGELPRSRWPGAPTSGSTSARNRTSAFCRRRQASCPTATKLATTPGLAALDASDEWHRGHCSSNTPNSSTGRVLPPGPGCLGPGRDRPASTGMASSPTLRFPRSVRRPASRT